MINEGTISGASVADVDLTQPDQAGDLTHLALISRPAPLPPALPASLLRLELLLDSCRVDLRAVSAAVRSDLGLAVAFLSRCGRHFFHDGKALRIEDTVVELGPDKIRAILRQTRPLATHPRGASAVEACRQYWQRARLTALVAEELASYELRCTPDEAYFAGMFYRLSDLPALMGWNSPRFSRCDSNNVSCALADAWHLPEVLGIGRSAADHDVNKIAVAADTWVEHMEDILGGQFLSDVAEGRFVDLICEK